MRCEAAFTIGQGLYQFRVMPFRPATFERLMERVLVTIPRSQCVVWLDDLPADTADFGGAQQSLRGSPGQPPGRPLSTTLKNATS